jgi:hypothetical protein
MMQQFDFDHRSPATNQLLAASLHVLTALRSYPHVLLSVPIHVHQQLEPADYGKIIYDLLSANYTDLEKRLKIQVHQDSHFSISTHPAGAQHEVP